MAPLVQAKNILIATGSYAIKAPIEGSEHGITSDEVLNLEELPGKCAFSICAQTCT